MTEEERKRKEKRRFYNVMNASKRDAYNKATYKGFYIRLRKEKDADLINHLSRTPNVTDYIRNLIVADMNGSGPHLPARNLGYEIVIQIKNK